MVAIELQTIEQLNEELTRIRSGEQRQSSSSSDPSLNSLSLRIQRGEGNDDGDADDRFSFIEAADLEALINGVAPLEKLFFHLRDVIVLGDFSLIYNALGNCKHLKDLQTCTLIPVDSPEDALAWGQAMARLPCLEEVQTPCNHCSFKALTQVLQGNKLQKIWMRPAMHPADVGEGESTGDEIRHFFLACQASPTLQELGCFFVGYSDMFAPPMDWVAQLLENTSSLTELTLSFFKNISFISLAEALKNNQSLKKLHLMTYTGSGYEGRGTVDENLHSQDAAAFFTMLKKHNFTLENLVIDPWKFGDDEYDVQKPMWERALDRQVCLMPAEFQAHVTGIFFLVGLNKAGRSRLHAAMTSSDQGWIGVLANQTDLSVVYYYLRLRPNFMLSLTTRSMKRQKVVHITKS